MVDIIEEEAILCLSRVLNTDIWTFVIQTSSRSFGFAVYNETVRRHFFVSEGEVNDNLYEPLEQEKGLNINESIFSDDILKLAEKLGLDLEGKGQRTYTVKQLSYSDEMKNELEQFRQQQNQTIADKKPWWKLW